MERSRLVAILTVLVLLGSALSLVLVLTRPDPDPAPSPPGTLPYRAAAFEGASGPALHTAVTAVPAALSYDFRDLPKSLKTATATMTAAFARDFRKTFRQRAVPVARSRKAVTEAVVLGAAVVRARGKAAVTCLVFVNQRQLQGLGVAQNDAPKVLARSRVLVDLVLRSGVWKIDGIRPI